MTKKDFKNLKKGDTVYIPKAYSKDKKEFLTTQVIEIDRYFEKLQVILGKRKYSYKYVRKSLKKDQFSRHFCGMSTLPPKNIYVDWKFPLYKYLNA